jgi:glycosyltransferase involved in cell wall biosynthesis
MSIVFSHPTGNANSRAAVVSLAKERLLQEFHTSIAAFPGSWLDKLSLGPLKEIRRRSFDPLLQPFTYTHPWFEASRMLASKAGLQGLIRHENGIFSIDAVYRHLDNKVAQGLYRAKKSGAKGIYAYEDGALASFTEAKGLGMKCFYDLPIGYWRSSQLLLSLERKKWPEWSATLTGLTDSEQKLSNKDKELKLADCIFVASSFTASTLHHFPGSLPPIVVIPYGFPSVDGIRAYKPFAGVRRLKILFVGGLSQRKGIADLFNAVDALSERVELTIVGSKPNISCPALETALAKHRWIPTLPHYAILQLMRQQDVLVFPSLFEGFGLVITEAMSQGTPVITTERTAGPDLIKDGENGWLIEAGSTSGLQASIERLIGKPEMLPKVGKAAMETARCRPWEVYGMELAKAIEKYI